MFTIGVCLFLLALAPVIWGLQLVAWRLAGFRRLNPIEQNLQRASHGVAWMVGVVAIMAGAFGMGASAEMMILIIRDSNNPIAWAILGLAAAVFAAGALRCYAGVRTLRFIGWEPLYIARAVVKLALGAAGVVWLETNGLGLAYARGSWDGPDSVWPVVGWVIAWWLLITGAVRLAVLLRPQPSSARDMVSVHIEEAEWSWGDKK